MLTAEPQNTGISLEVHYRELARLADKIDLLTQSAFDDIKLLGGIGVLIGWKPLLEGLTGPAAGNVALLFLGFVVIAFALGIIGFAALMKQSVALFYLREIRHYEAEVRSELGREDLLTFRVAGAWAAWANRVQRPLGRVFYFFFYLVVCLFPVGVLGAGTTANWLSFHAGWWLALVYLLIALAICRTHFQATAKIVFTEENLGPARET